MMVETGMPCLRKKEIVSKQTTDKYARSEMKEGRSHKPAQREGPLASLRLQQGAVRDFWWRGRSVPSLRGTCRWASRRAMLQCRVRASEH